MLINDARCKNKNLFLTLCCRENEWENNKQEYEEYLNDRINIIHKNGEELNYTREGAHSINRIVHHKDTTGKEVIQKLLLNVENRNNIDIMEMATVIDLISKNNKCFGVSVKKSGVIENIF